MTTKPMYDAKLSDITSYAVWAERERGKVILTFGVWEDKLIRPIYYKRVVTSRYFSNFSVDTIVFNKKRYLIDVEVVEALDHSN